MDMFLFVLTGWSKWRQTWIYRIPTKVLFIVVDKWKIKYSNVFYKYPKFSKICHKNWLVSLVSYYLLIILSFFPRKNQWTKIWRFLNHKIVIHFCIHVMEKSYLICLHEWNHNILISRRDIQFWNFQFRNLEIDMRAFVGDWIE